MVTLPEAQVNLWPGDLLPPQPPETSGRDSNGIDFVSLQSLYMNTVISTDSLKLAHDGGRCGVRQLAYYRMENNELFQSRKHYFDFSGSVVRKGCIGPWGSVGIDWTPILLLNSSKVNHALSASLDIGPVIQGNVMSLPVTLRGGLAGRLQDDSLSLASFREAASGNARRDDGLYGAFDVGAADLPIGSLPLYVNVKGYGRSQATSKLFSGVGSALFCRDFPTGDTLSLLYTDSLVNGSGVVLGDEGAQGKSFFLDIPQSIVRSYQMKAGLLGKYRFHVQPAFFYSYALHSLQYPASGGESRSYTRLSDRQNTVRSVNALLSSDSSSFIFYTGGIRIDMEKEEKLFRNGIIADRFVDPGNLDTLSVKLNDYDGYRAVMKQVLSLHTPGGIGVEYTYNISRYLKTYPFSYFKKNELSGNSNTIVWIDTVRSNEDKDWIVQNHHLDITPVKGATGFLDIIGEYSTNLSYNLKKGKSANNSVDYFYLIRENSLYCPSEKLRLESTATADIKRTRYVFLDQYLQLGFLPPSYSREATAQAAAMRRIGETTWLRAEWREHYEDDGYWYEKEPVDSTREDGEPAASAFTPYYGIERMQWRHSLSLMDSMTIRDYFKCTMGTSLEYIYQKKYNDLHGTYERDASQTRYVVVPFLTADALINDFFMLKARIRRNIDTVKDDYWDFTILFTARF
jgi:hypothetical protein